MISSKFIAVLVAILVGLSPALCYASDLTTPASIYYDSPLTVELVPMELESVNTSLQRVSASDSTGLKSIMLSLIGDYDTVVTDYVYSNGSYQSHSISIERDWSWIMSCALFIVVLYCVFRCVGGILCK